MAICRSPMRLSRVLRSWYGGWAPLHEQNLLLINAYCWSDEQLSTLFIVYSFRLNLGNLQKSNPLNNHSHLWSPWHPQGNYGISVKILFEYTTPVLVIWEYKKSKWKYVKNYLLLCDHITIWGTKQEKKKITYLILYMINRKPTSQIQIKGGGTNCGHYIQLFI